MAPDQLAAAHQELETLRREHAVGAPGTLADTADRDFWRADSSGGTLLALDNLWPAGFSWERADGGAWTCGCPAGALTGDLFQHGSDPSGVLAAFDEACCQRCPMLPACPVHRQEFTVRLGLLLLEGVSGLRQDLCDADSGLGRAQATADVEPCLVGWTEARVDAGGELFICSECGSEPVGNVADSSLAAVWYSRELNEFRRMTLGASLALPYVDRRACGLRCSRMGDSLAIMAHLRQLPEAAREVLEAAGSGDRLDGAETQS